MNKPTNVLLIEDDPGDLRLIQEMLSETKGHSFELEHTGRLSSGLGRLAEGASMQSCWTSDYLTVRGTCVSVHDQAPELPIIVLIGFDDTAVADSAVREGAQDYLAKGEVDGNSLARSLNYSIERKRAKDALRESEERLKIKLDYILSPDNDVKNVSLTDLVDLEELQQIQDAFAAANDVASII
ncbi:MAG: hypothetical protein ACXQTY_04130 [Candidatus Methanogasteraceae archaeon]